MDKKYLDKVVDQLVRETRIDYDEGWLYTPFSSLPSYISLFLPPHYFSHHCNNVYGLNKHEIEYVWNEYRKIIKDKIS